MRIFSPEINAGHILQMLTVSGATLAMIFTAGLWLQQIRDDIHAETIARAGVETELRAEIAARAAAENVLREQMGAMLKSAQSIEADYQKLFVYFQPQRRYK